MSDDYLLAALRVAAGTDPMPARVAADARGAFGLHLPGAVTATPVAVPPAPAGGYGTRSGTRADRRSYQDLPTRIWSDGCPLDGESRLLRFAVDGLTIDVEVAICDSHFDLAGQVHPAPGEGTRVEIRTPYVSKVRYPSEAGEFATTGLPHGWLSVVCHRPAHPPVATRWHRVRP
ncbi:hypothetical protein [Sphaerisporangium sp. TRM90804]|uniref:hypothetical protein n=1 Tax=Sphaerisporangium sp. TRM90804 TaxID=3031113 RepID=UPI002448BE36|nr:hypothetical protein [Sphaerisporangium sp. TRM90804]MDH2428263.1 hypothetical protein [Sphaerisporangium sp. TRM90804]